MRVLFLPSQIGIGAMVLLAGCAAQPLPNAGPTHFVAARPVVVAQITVLIVSRGSPGWRGRSGRRENAWPVRVGNERGLLEGAAKRAEVLQQIGVDVQRRRQRDQLLAADESLVGRRGGDAGRRGRDLHEAASHLFRALREADRLKPPVIEIAPMPDDGIGEAINDRIRRAAGFVG